MVVGTMSQCLNMPGLLRLWSASVSNCILFWTFWNISSDCCYTPVTADPTYLAYSPAYSPARFDRAKDVPVVRREREMLACP
ncbi:hypothetical protein SAMD00023353_1200410 [Rosellinia necatrix]|uniref:Uncharacterized protein n=1 Tax=Rosellinia necatrix TaxID=77044 RepID=A0A1S8A6K1_ROSNE|nr:hypothetical protein SAMD00023353_1200410 [Rosellinia necatrix]